MAREPKEEAVQDCGKLAMQALKDPAALEDLVGQLSQSSRAKRQKAASALARVAEEDVQLLVPYVEELSEGLNRMEAQTRWELLHILDLIGRTGHTYDDDVLGLAEDALYDESNGFVREAAFRFFCGYGSASPENSDEVWPLIDEAIQCYHGNGEFTDMLVSLVEFAQADISMETCTALALRMKFDAENASGTLRMRAEQIVRAFEERGGKLKNNSQEDEDGD